MLKDRILSTLKLFDFQDYPLTLLELEYFLVNDLQQIKDFVDGQGELKNGIRVGNKEKISIDQILSCLDSECPDVETYLGFYFLKGRKDIVDLRLKNYFYGIRREKLIRRYAKVLKHIPFVRGVALAGSQAMGQQKESSDIDLLIIAEANFLWLMRTLVTAYFQLMGKRRHDQQISNRFCLNHYMVGPKEITQLRNLYTAGEYLKLRPLCYEHVIWAFGRNNPWLKAFFPQVNLPEPPMEKQSRCQSLLEKIFTNSFGHYLERVLKNWQLPKIRQERFIVVEDDELSFHPYSKQEKLLDEFLRFMETAAQSDSQGLMNSISSSNG